VSVFLCLVITQVGITLIMEGLCQATLPHAPPTNHLQQPY